MADKLIFFGNERIATGVTTSAPVLETLVKLGYEVSAVVVAQNKTSASRKQRKLEVAEVAEKHGIPVISPVNLRASIDDLKSYDAKAAVLVAYGKLVPQEVIDIFPSGIINIHPSLLPKHRGSAPIESAILHGDKETGVSLMQLVKEMDAGPVYAQETVLLHGSETKQQLAEQLLNLGADMLKNYLPHILDGSLQPHAQNESQATTDGRINKEDSELKLKEKTADQLAKEIRAFAGWPKSKTMLGTTEVVITRAHAEDASGVPGTLQLDKQQVGLFCKQGLLIIDALIPAGKKEMPASAFLAGYSPTD